MARKIFLFAGGGVALLFAAVLAINAVEKAAARGCHANDGSVSDEICAIVVEKCRLKGCGGPPTEGFWAAYFNWFHGTRRG